jgi:hypothetical protein
MKLNEFHDDSDPALGMKAEQMHADHEIQMARADCYKIAKYAIDLHNMLKDIPDSANLEGWVQRKITIASDYMSSVKHYLEYEKISGAGITVAEETLDENLRLIGKLGDQNRSAKIYRDNDWNEYRVRFYTNNNYDGEDSDHHTDDKEDAFNTATSVVSQGVNESSGTSSGAIASSLGAGNGFLNGGPGTLSRAGVKKTKKK